MTAKELFNTASWQSGLKTDTLITYIRYYSSEQVDHEHFDGIAFLLDEKVVRIFTDCGSVSLDIDTYNAITQQMKQLGWIQKEETTNVIIQQ